MIIEIAIGMLIAWAAYQLIEKLIWPLFVLWAVGREVKRRANQKQG